ncbi:Hypothetical predicted protein [Paramuricea clavata]|uniref:Uncharacterized protein n=1 Tax=Paramuricea clavata TaxID=317549 RepID=A0A7D9INJ7_PARCT|nr:Hypothetical predicted protein [Paramuricea clavata]
MQKVIKTYFRHSQVPNRVHKQVEDKSQRSEESSFMLGPIMDICHKSNYVNVADHHHPYNVEEICTDNSPSYPDYTNDDGMICEESNLTEPDKTKVDTKEIGV